MKIQIFAVVAALSVSAAAFGAGDGATLFKSNNCSGCHLASGKSLGPSLAEISAKYKESKGAYTTLEAKVRSGGKGSFGAMPMPPTAASVSDGDIKTMVAWILSHK